MVQPQPTTPQRPVNPVIVPGAPMMVRARPRDDDGINEHPRMRLQFDDNLNDMPPPPQLVRQQAVAVVNYQPDDNFYRQLALVDRNLFQDVQNMVNQEPLHDLIFLDNVPPPPPQRLPLRRQVAIPYGNNVVVHNIEEVLNVENINNVELGNNVDNVNNDEDVFNFEVVFH